MKKDDFVIIRKPLNINAKSPWAKFRVKYDGELAVVLQCDSDFVEIEFFDQLIDVEFLELKYEAVKEFKRWVPYVSIKKATPIDIIRYRLKKCSR